MCGEQVWFGGRNPICVIAHLCRFLCLCHSVAESKSQKHFLSCHTERCLKVLIVIRGEEKMGDE